MTFEELVTPGFIKGLLLYAGRFTLRQKHGHQNAEDLVGMTLLRAYEKFHQYDPKWKFSTWVYTILRRIAFDKRYEFKEQFGPRKHQTYSENKVLKPVFIDHYVSENNTTKKFEESRIGMKMSFSPENYYIAQIDAGMEVVPW